MRTLSFVLACAMVVTAAPASAQSPFSDLARPKERPYRHPHSRIELPRLIEGMPRDSLRQIGDQELDVVAQYEDGRNELVSVYVYRLVAGAVPVWFDRARWSIENRADVYGQPRPAGVATAFTPPGQATASGLTMAWNLSKPPYRATALAILPVNGWLVKVRYSSATHDAQALSTRMPAVLAALRWPNRIEAQPVATEVTECTTPLATSGEARPVTGRDERISDAIIGGLVHSLPKDGVPTATWCRDPATLPVGAAYRADGDAHRYTIALGDSGRALTVGPSLMMEAQPSSGGASRHLIALVDMGRTLVYDPVDRLPTPVQALQLFQASKVIAATTTWGATTETRVDPAALR